jgi:dephospho-CoA kinase
MISVGLSGGIGSGKSTVLRIFSLLNVPVYLADDRAKYLLDNEPILKSKLEEHFSGIYKDGKLDKLKFAGIIFSDAVHRELANSIIHPFVRADFQEWRLRQSADYVIQEAAILFETGAYKFFDKNILICAPEGYRIERIKARDKMDEAAIRSRMSAQWKDEQKRPLSDYCIENDEKHSLIDQVLKIHEELSQIR